MKTRKTRKEIMAKRRIRVRKKIIGTAQRPRLSVYRSNNQTYAQLIDDGSGVTLIALSTLDTGLKGELKSMRTMEAARRVGKELAERARRNGIEAVVFDRGGYRYHGRVKALAEGAREGGLVF
ncbi:50S ribosomal protein L18 [candidate division WWE3 bacterium]|uniref:Large ribosomal subunit protein uL18 n=1 Tax=candidate division WWE3 bacterium TaxID=2053526 RepID=A0A955RQL8_UNCKA|nr:50S ribosomal protein L18 [candidate division WWE3 bacterium]